MNFQAVLLAISGSDHSRIRNGMLCPHCGMPTAELFARDFDQVQDALRYGDSNLKAHQYQHRSCAISCSIALRSRIAGFDLRRG